MRKNAKVANERLKEVLLKDKVYYPDKLVELIKSDVKSLLENYFELFPEGVQLSIKSGDYGIEIYIDALAERIKGFGVAE